MTEEEYQEIIDACQPVPYIIVGGSAPSSPQENANRAWMALGKKRGFDGMTVMPGGSKLEFTAVPSETEHEREARIAKEKEDERKRKIAKLKEVIRQANIQLMELDEYRTGTEE